MTAAGLSRLVQPEAIDRISAAISIGNAGSRPLTLVLDGIPAAALPAAWAGAAAFEVGAASLSTAPAAALDSLYQWLRARHPGLTALPRLALPYVVVAPTKAEIGSLLATDRCEFDGFDDELDRADRIADLGLMADSARAASKGWPEGHYSEKRQDWRCFGSRHASIEGLLLESIARINNASDGTRERRLLREARILGRPYRLEELLDDRYGSASALLAAIERGGLVMIDELALLHPRLRAAAKRLLRAGRTAVVSLSACDPAHSPTRRLIGSRSFMHVGSLITRFADEQDPRCEVAVNSIERLQRWWRLAIPDLVALGETAEARVELVDKVEGLFMEP